jgi:hypothetical protein
VNNIKPTITEAETERLSLIRYQLMVASETVAAAPPINTLAINLMQDAVESALATAGDHVQAKVPNHPDFDKLFDAVVAALSNPPELVGVRQAAIAMNNARVGFKHHGNQVRDETLRKHYDVAATLVNELVLAAFGIPLSEVSLLLFVRDDQARELIESAEAHKDKGDLVQAMFRLRLAFELVAQEYQSRKSVDGWHTVFETKPSFYPSTFDFKRELGGKGGEYVEKVGKWVESLDKLTRLGAIGIDLQRYAYFDAVAPVAQYYISDTPTSPFVRFKELTDEHYAASYRFVVDSAIRLGANDYTLRRTSREIDRNRSFNPDYVPKDTTATEPDSASPDQGEATK